MRCAIATALLVLVVFLCGVVVGNHFSSKQTVLRLLPISVDKNGNAIGLYNRETATGGTVVGGGGGGTGPGGGGGGGKTVGGTFEIKIPNPASDREGQ